MLGVGGLLNDARHLLPPGERWSTQRSIVYGANRMATESEEIPDRNAYRQDAPRLAGRLEAPNLTLPLPGRFMRNLGRIVRVLLPHVGHRRQGGVSSGSIALELVRRYPGARCDASARGFRQFRARPN